MKQKRNQRATALLLAIITAFSFTLAACTKTEPNQDDKANDTEISKAPTYFVSPEGSDENDGLSAETAFATIEKARDMVRTINSNMTEDIIVCLLDGVWELEQTLTFDQRDSGTNGYYVRYMAANDAAPTLSGGIRLTGTWTTDRTLENGTTIYKIPLDRDDKLRALYINGERRYMASTEEPIEAKGSWGSYFIGNMPSEEDYLWETAYREDFELGKDVSDMPEIVPWAKSGNSLNAVLRVAEEDGNHSIQLTHTANEDCGFEIPGITYKNAIITCRVQFASEHSFTHDWEAGKCMSLI